MTPRTQTTQCAFRQRRGFAEPGEKGTPRTRQSPLTLAAFRPWGSSQVGRRAGSTASVVPALGDGIARRNSEPVRSATIADGGFA